MPHIEKVGQTRYQEIFPVDITFHRNLSLLSSREINAIFSGPEKQDAMASLERKMFICACHFFKIVKNQDAKTVFCDAADRSVPCFPFVKVKIASSLLNLVEEKNKHMRF